MIQISNLQDIIKRLARVPTAHSELFSNGIHKDLIWLLSSEDIHVLHYSLIALRIISSRFKFLYLY